MAVADPELGKSRPPDVDPDEVQPEPMVPDSWTDLRKKAQADETSTSWRQKAEECVRGYIRIIVWPDSAESLNNELMANPSALETGGDLGLLMIHIDAKQRGEAVTSPSTRVCPLQPKTYEWQISQLLEARWKGSPSQGKKGLNPAEVAVILDGGKFGNKKALLT
eukprot:6319375-Lingulodinium_polyedra.AAC.1